MIDVEAVRDFKTTLNILNNLVHHAVANGGTQFIDWVEVRRMLNDQLQAIQESIDPNAEEAVEGDDELFPYDDGTE
jgi:hypothetical protein